MSRGTSSSPGRRVPRILVAVLVATASAWCVPPFAAAQGRPATLGVSFPGGEGTSLPIATHRGYAAVPASALTPMGWRTLEAGAELLLEHRTGLELRFTHASPFLRWDGRLLHMADAAYRLNDELHVPLQLLVDLFPGFLPQAYGFDEATGILRVAEPPTGPPARPGPDASRPEAGSGDARTAPGDARPAREDRPAGAGPAPFASRDARGSSAPRPSRLVVIDPGHGGDDPGAIGRGGTREKDVALAVALALARELSGDPDLEVRLTRERDVPVPLWRRGEMATEWRGGRPGVFISLHANSLGNRPAVRGFETYFLSEARTEHERRVAAAENAPLLGEREGGDAMGVADPLLADILRDLRTFDHQHWSALLAEQVQREMGGFHPGPNRGVKQGPFAVITNALMPSVLVELGFLSHRDEERLLTRPEFHRQSAEAIARAVRAFFERYPPRGSGS